MFSLAEIMPWLPFSCKGSWLRKIRLWLKDVLELVLICACLCEPVVCTPALFHGQWHHLVAWSRPWWEYLLHGNWQTLQIRSGLHHKLVVQHLPTHHCSGCDSGMGSSYPGGLHITHEVPGIILIHSVFGNTFSPLGLQGSCEYLTEHSALGEEPRRSGKAWGWRFP